MYNNDNNIINNDIINNNDVLINTCKIELTNEQQYTYNELMNFVSNKNEKEILLIGYAGTGKTTLIAKFINDMIKNKISKKIVMAAPTHKAVNIAKSKLFSSKEDYEELNETINIMTIHRLLNYQSYVGIEGEKFFAKGKIDPNWSIYDLVVVDECSMLSNQIISDIKNEIIKESNLHTKIIYLGDPAQLPPVNQAESKIFNGNIKTLTLDKIIRTSNQKIMELSNSHRKWTQSKKNEDIPHICEYEDESIKLYSTENKETKQWLDDFVNILKSDGNNNKIITEFDYGIETKSNDYKNENDNNCIKMTNHIKLIDNYNNNIILTWTNKKSNIYNQYVREKIFNKKNLSQWEIGEILIFNDFHKKDIYEEEYNDLDIESKPKKISIRFYTSEQVKLTDIKQIKYKFKLLKFKINNNLTPELNDKFKKYYKKINKLINIELDVYEMIVKKIIDINENKKIIPEYTIISIHSNSEKIYNGINEQIEKNILLLKTSCYKIINNIKNNDNNVNNVKCNLQSEVEKKINKLYKEYMENVIDCFAELNYGYCITVHKSQGSTFKNVFVDMNDILNNNNINETSKCLYTSITRSSKSLYLLV